jgi:hypothetical protein
MQQVQTKARRGRPSKKQTQETEFTISARDPLLHGIAIPTKKTFLTEWRQLSKDLKRHNIKINDVARQALTKAVTEMKAYLQTKQN